jgi:hypothetical protein
MVFSVYSAFNDFRKNCVDLDSDDTKIARSSRDYLFEQIKRLASNDLDFPRLNSFNQFISFGSFSRKTKIRPLDDIDFLVLLDGYGTEAVKHYSNEYFKLKIKNPPFLISKTSPLLQFTESDYYNTEYVNSTRILNRIKSHLSSIANYRNADIKKNLQAITLNLKSYDWTYDIVPAVPISNDGIEIIYYLIPDGCGNWIPTDPRIDALNTKQVNLIHNGKFLALFRMLKYWNNRTIKTVLNSYYFETLAIKVFNNSNESKFQTFQEAINYFFATCPYYISLSCPDPKGLGQNLDKDITADTKYKIIHAMNQAKEDSYWAIINENLSNHKDAIFFWKKIFGGNFPDYG